MPLHRGRLTSLPDIKSIRPLTREDLEEIKAKRSLPVVARWLGATPKGVTGVGLLYSANTVGAVLGCLLAGFYLLRVHDMAIATLVAAAVA